MKLLLVAAALLALAAARPQARDGEAYIDEYSADNDGLGTYAFGFKTSNGIIRQENAILKNAGTEDEELEIRGTITWVDVDGKENSIVFVANKDGYQPQVSP
ncbi:hypothetical protein R5R35_008910 [Gryllus longicercus]|uniref:Accessory gland protein n=1 Tax=Gryllus longicercus TaxID=2509291 RepID=A0AAN9VSP4_9ORTH